MEVECCKDCKFYKEGDCRRFPPQFMTSIDSEFADYRDALTSVSGSSYSAFPQVEANEWCGEFVAIKGK